MIEFKLKQEQKVSIEILILKCYRSEKVLNRFDLNKKDIPEKVYFKHKSALMWPLMAFKVKLDIMENLHLYIVIMDTKFR